jgi:hydroxypyruvate isomerase
MPRLAANVEMSLDAESVPAGIERAAAVDLDAVEFFDWERADLDAVAQASEDHGVDVAAILSAGAGSTIESRDEPALTDPQSHEQAVDDIARSLDAAARLDCESLIVTVGPDQPDIDDATQEAAIVDVLGEVAPQAESTGVTIVVEPLNVSVDHPGYFLDSVATGAAIVERVDSDAVQLLFDAYHQQVAAGNVIETFREHVEKIGHVHVADVPGRGEPGTGELAYERIVEAIDETGYDGYVSGEYLPTGSVGTALARFVTVAGRK